MQVGTRCPSRMVPEPDELLSGSHNGWYLREATDLTSPLCKKGRLHRFVLKRFHLPARLIPDAGLRKLLNCLPQLDSSRLKHELASLTSRGWRILFDSSCSAWFCSAASIVEPLHHCPIAVGKSAAHLVCRPAALVACPFGPAHKIAKSQRGGSTRLARLSAQ